MTHVKTIEKVVKKVAHPVALFNTLRANKEGNDAFLLESADIVEKYGDKSVGCVDPCLKITVKNKLFTILALNDVGKAAIAHIKDDFGFAKDVAVTEDTITGEIKKSDQFQDEETRLKEKNVFDILRVLAFKFIPDKRYDIPSCGLFGMISYDAIDYFEELPQNEEDDTPDIEFYYADKLFIIDHVNKQTHFFVTLIDQNTTEQDAEKTIQEYEAALETSQDYTIATIPESKDVETTVSDPEFEELVTTMKEHINDGDVFQCVLSRSFKTKTTASPLEIYGKLRDINPGPYMFYFESKDHVLLGSSPETCLKVEEDKKTNEKIVEIKPIAGTLPRGKNPDGSINPDLDSRLEVELLLDRKELAEHCMLVDLARNDVAKVSKPATRFVPEILKIQKFSHVQHIVSTVHGHLRDDLDALHAYVATMNMGTLTGAPKIKAMELIRKYEKEKRGFYGGSVCYLTPFGDFDSCIVIRSIFVKDDVAKVQAGAGVVYDSKPKNEANETRRKADACLVALGVNIE